MKLYFAQSFLLTLIFQFIFIDFHSIKLIMQNELFIMTYKLIKS